MYVFLCGSEFQDIFDVDHFISSLRDEVRILKKLPPRVKKRVELGMFHSLPPISWSDIFYYHDQVDSSQQIAFIFCLLNPLYYAIQAKQLSSLTICQQILPLVKKHKVVHLNKTDARLANNGLPIELQKLRCRVNFNALRFTPQIEELGKKVARILWGKGPFLVLHLRYEMDMLSFSGCTRGCNDREVEELSRMRQSSIYFLCLIIHSLFFDNNNHYEKYHTLVDMVILCGRKRI